MMLKRKSEIRYYHKQEKEPWPHFQVELLLLVYASTSLLCFYIKICYIKRVNRVKLTS